MPQKWTGKWQGGRTLSDKYGGLGWVLERMVDGARFSRRLDAKSEKEALAELALFERDPVKYVTRKEEAQDARANALVVNAENVGLVKAHLEKNGRDPHYIRVVVQYLATWAEDLAGRDLRKTKLEDLKRILNSHDTARPKRISALKTFTAYFRGELSTLPAHEDPTIALMSIQSKPEKMQRDKGYPIEVVEAVYAAIFNWEAERTDKDRFGRDRTRGCIVAGRRKAWGDLQGVRDVLVMRAKFGMHQSEIDRLSSGNGIIKPVKGHGEIAGTIKFKHKSGDDHLVSVDVQGLAAAQRLQAHGAPISDGFLRTTLEHAARKAGLTSFNPGELRHSFITIAKDAGREVKPKLGGVPVETIAAVVGHHGTHTTRASYLGAHVPVMIALPLKLQHPDDPMIFSGLKVV